MKSLKLKNFLENFINFIIQYEKKKVTTSFSFFFLYFKLPIIFHMYY